MTDDPDNMAQANARPEVSSAAVMTNAAEDLDTGKHESTQHSQDTFNKRRKLDIDTPANQQDELDAAKQALLRRLFGPEPTTQSSADVTTASATGEPHDTVRGSTVVEPERGHSLPENVEDPDARSHDSDDKPASAVDGTTATMGGNKDSEAKEAPPLSNSQATPASDSSSTAKSQITSASTTLTTPRLEETAPPYPFRNGYSRVLQSQRKAMWSPDGKCILTTCSDLCLRTHVLFNQRNEPPPSVYVGVYEAPSTIASFTPAPWFDTEEADTMHVVVSVQDHPIRLFNINDPDSKTVQAYSLMSETDDVQFIKAASMKFKPDGRQFVCGGLNSVAIFDINRERPVAHLHTHHNSKRKNKLDPYALSGSILSLDYRHDGVLAVGTTSSKIGFYTNYGEGEAIISENFSTKSAGEGIDALRWSPDGNYLYISQKRSNVINILDIRFSTRRLASLTNRPGNTTQSLSIDLKLHDNGYHVIAGGTDGVVRAWENPFTRSESSIRPDLEWKAHDDIVANAVANPVYQDYLVTTAGSDKFPTEDEYDTSDDDEDSERIVAKKRGRSEEERVPDAPVLPGWMKIWSFMT